MDRSQVDIPLESNTYRNPSVELEMETNLFAKLSRTASMEMPDEVVDAIPRGLSQVEAASVSGGAAKTKHIVFTVPDKITVTNSSSGGAQDDCLD